MSYGDPKPTRYVVCYEDKDKVAQMITKYGPEYWEERHPSEWESQQDAENLDEVGRLKSRLRSEGHDGMIYTYERTHIKDNGFWDTYPGLGRVWISMWDSEEEPVEED